MGPDRSQNGDKGSESFDHIPICSQLAAIRTQTIATLTQAEPSPRVASSRTIIRQASMVFPNPTSSARSPLLLRGDSRANWAGIDLIVVQIDTRHGKGRREGVIIPTIQRDSMGKELQVVVGETCHERSLSERTGRQTASMRATASSIFKSNSSGRGLGPHPSTLRKSLSPSSPLPPSRRSSGVISIRI
jgi:hypothetical protein